MNEHHQSIHQRALEIARQFRTAESDLIDILQKIDDEKIFVRLGFGSLFDYAVNALKLSEANASNFSIVARKSKLIPELKIAIRRGDITVSKARKIAPVLMEQNQEYWLKLAKELPKSKLEQEVARVAPLSVRSDRAKYISGDLLELRLTVSERTMTKLKRAQNLVSQKSRSAASLEQTLSEVLEEYLERIDPVKKAKRNLKITDVCASIPGARQISAQLKHQIHNRDQGRCTHRDKIGRRCENERWLEIHHLIPLSAGGNNNTENLRTLCSAHHKMLHLN